MRAQPNVATAQNEATIEREHEPSAAGAGDVRELGVDTIDPDPGQPRRAFDDAKLRTLAALTDPLIPTVMGWVEL